MKVRVLKNFVSGRFAANCGEVIDLPETVGKKLKVHGFVEPIEQEPAVEPPVPDNEEPPAVNQDPQEKVEPAKDEEPPASEKEPEKSSKSGKKTTGNK